MEKIIKTTYEIIILDACGDEYDNIDTNDEHKPFSNLKEVCKYVVEMKKHDKELGAEFGVWDYRVVRWEETKDTRYYSVFKVYKYKGMWKYKRDYKFEESYMIR